MTVRVTVVDDNELVRAGLVTVLGSDPDVEVVAESGDGPSGVRAAMLHRPDVVLMDVEMAEGNGLTATARLLELLPEARVLILTMFDLDEYVHEALRVGACGFLIKTTEPHALVAAVKECAAGETTLGPSVVRRLVENYVSSRPVAHPPGADDLTVRERDVLRAMARGLTNAEIARDLHLAETTVKTHVAHILAKLGVRDRVRAVVLALDCGLA